jgi:flavodoxin
LTKAIVVYESKYGNTKRVADTVAEAMRQNGVETVVSELKEVDPDKISDYNAILIGSPNHIRGPTRSVRKFIDNMGKLGLKENLYAVFDTYIGKDFETAVKKMEKLLEEKVPDLKRIAPGLSVRVQGMKGPIPDEELPKCKEFGNKIAMQIKTG